MQPVPEGYMPLDFVGFTDRGLYSPGENYVENDIVHKDNTAWRCLKDNTTGIAPAEGENWTVFIASETDSSGITTTDTEGLVGTAGEKVSNQALIDAIADRVINRLLSKTAISTTQINDPDKVPSSSLVFGMSEEISGLNRDIDGYLSDNDNITQKDIMMYRRPDTTVRKSDANNFLKTGYYFTTPDTLNAANYGIVSVLSVTSPWITQTWHRVGGEIFTRVYSNIYGNKWSSWEKLCTESDMPLRNIVYAGIVPTEVNVIYEYTNPNIANKNFIVATFDNSIGSVLVTPYTRAGASLNVKSDNQYWGGEIEVNYDKGSGTVRFRVVWKGSSQIMGNFELRNIIY